MDVTDNISKSFCIMPWIGIATTPSGGIRPCCWMSNSGNYRGDISDYESSDYLKDIKEHFLNGTYPKSCYRCEWNDKNGLTSKRIKENELWLRKNSIDDYQQQKYSIIDLRLSNKCNLLCVTCSPKSSSAIFDEVKSNPIHQFHYTDIFDKISSLNLTSPYSEKDKEGLIDRISPYARVYFTGGEPSLVKPSFSILENLIEKGYNKTISLEFNSNFQSFNKKWINLLKEFKGIMMPSIDAIGLQAEYIRYGSVWNTIDKNIREFIKECKDFKIIIYPTVSILNIFYINDILEWSKTLECDVEVNLQNRLYDPSYYDIKNLPNNLKIKANQYLSEIKHKHIEEIKIHLNSPSEDNEWIKFIENINKVDKVRNTNWRITLNELIDCR